MRNSQALIAQARAERLRIFQEKSRMVEEITNHYLNSLIAQNLIGENCIADVMRYVAKMKGYQFQVKRAGAFRFLKK